MIEFYSQIKLAHVTAVIASGLLFMIRGSLVQGGVTWAMSAPMRYLSYGIDTVLLTAGLMLFTILPSAVFSNGWLSLKILLLVLYIILGTFALKRGRTARQRGVLFVIAVLVYGCMYLIARTHDPLGPLKMIASAFS